MVRRLTWLFALAGAAILAGLTIALFSGETRIRIPAITALVTFVAVILSYLGGIEAGIALQEERSTEKRRALALCLSVFPALAAWGVLWLPSTQSQVGAALVLFIALWGADLWLARQGLVPAWFVDLRTAVTVAVCLILGLALYLI
jgi:uncharacterized membrane protein